MSMGSPRELRDERLTVPLQVTLNDQQKTDSNVTQFVIGESRVRKFYVTSKVVTGATAPGTSKTVTVNVYFADEEVAPANVATVLASRKTALSAINLPNSTNTTQYNKLTSSSVEAEGKYLYLTVDQTALATGATVQLTVWLVSADN